MYLHIQGERTLENSLTISIQGDSMPAIFYDAQTQLGTQLPGYVRSAVRIHQGCRVYLQGLSNKNRMCKPSFFQDSIFFRNFCNYSATRKVSKSYVQQRMFLIFAFSNLSIFMRSNLPLITATAHIPYNWFIGVVLKQVEVALLICWYVHICYFYIITA